MIKKSLLGLIVGIFLGLLLPFIIEATLFVIGFRAKGILDGSFAAEIQAHMGNIEKGSLFACK